MNRQSAQKHPAKPAPQIPSLCTYPLTYDDTSIEVAAADILELSREIPKHFYPIYAGTLANCRFCGQSVIIPDNKLQDFRCFEDVIEYASTECACSEAKVYAQNKRAAEQQRIARQQSLMDAEIVIDEQFREESDGKPLLTDNMRTMLNEMAAMVYDHKARQFTVVLNKRIRAVIGRTSKDNLIIERKESDARRVEIE